MTIGLPFSGKTTLAEQYREQGWEVIRRDELLEGIVQGDDFKERVKKEVEKKEQILPGDLYNIRNKIAIEMITKAVGVIVEQSESENFFYDGTNVQREMRAGILKLSEEGIEVSGIYLHVPLDELKQRMIRAHEVGERREQFNEAAFRDITIMASVFDEPTKEEGFSELIVKNETTSEQELEFKHGMK